MVCNLRFYLVQPLFLYFNSDRLYKIGCKYQDIHDYLTVKKYFESAWWDYEKTELETGLQFVEEYDGLIYTFTESAGEYKIECEYNSSLIPIRAPWYKIRLNPREYDKKTLILDEVSVSFSTYEGTVADGIGYDYEIVAFYAETDGDGHITSPYSYGRNFIFCMPKETGERYLQEAHDKKGTRMIADEVKCGLYKMRGDNDNWYVVMFDIRDAEIQRLVFFSYKPQMQLDRLQMRRNNKHMKQTKGSETTIRITNKSKAIVEKVAAAERRSFKDQLAVLLEIGYAEYARRQKFLKDVEAGKTQIDAGAFSTAQDGTEARV